MGTGNITSKFAIMKPMGFVILCSSSLQHMEVFRENGLHLGMMDMEIEGGLDLAQTIMVFHSKRQEHDGLVVSQAAIASAISLTHVLVIPEGFLPLQDETSS